MPRNYVHFKEIGKEILEMKEEGKTKREIAEHFGLSREQIKNFISRNNKKEKKIKEGIEIRSKGRPRKPSLPL